MNITRVCALLMAGAIVCPLWAAESVEERLVALEGRVQQLEAALQVAVSNNVAMQARLAAMNSGTDVPPLQSRVENIEASLAQAALNDVTIHGYGELHYNRLNGRGGAADKKEADLHRFVLFFGRKFSDRLSFNSEVEIEHAYSGGSKPGEVEIEQAYFDYYLNDYFTVRAGLFLMPVGLLNTAHEPTRFYGVERAPVENAILPSTWREAGIGLVGDLGHGFRYEGYLHSGLKASASKLYAVRSGRQHAANANASNLAGTLALSWSKPGISLGGAFHYEDDITQGTDDEAGRAWMGEVHVDLRHGPYSLRALYANWDLSGSGPADEGADRQFGWYVEPAYRIFDNLGVFARYSQWDNLAGDRSNHGRKRQFDVGLNWWVHPQVVVKADYQRQFHEDKKRQDGLNLGIGYEF